MTSRTTGKLAAALLMAALGAGMAGGAWAQASGGTTSDMSSAGNTNGGGLPQMRLKSFPFPHGDTVSLTCSRRPGAVATPAGGSTAVSRARCSVLPSCSGRAAIRRCC